MTNSPPKGKRAVGAMQVLCCTHPLEHSKVGRVGLETRSERDQLPDRPSFGQIHRAATRKLSTPHTSLPTHSCVGGLDDLIADTSAAGAKPLGIGIRRMRSQRLGVFVLIPDFIAAPDEMALAQPVLSLRVV